MRSGRMRWVMLAVVAAMALAASAAAQAEPADGAGRLIERPYTAVLEGREDGTDWAGEVPFSGETSVFGGRCSVPSDWVFHMRWEGLDSVFGHFTVTSSHCAQVAWGVDAQGAPTMMGINFTDFEGLTTWADGSTLGGSGLHLNMGFDAEAGLITTSNVQYSVGEGTGRLAGATLFFLGSCRYRSDAAVIAGIESFFCTSQGTIQYDPFAGAGE